MKKNNKKRIILYAVAAVVLIAVLYLINNPITGNTISATETKKYDFSRAGNPDYYSLLPPKPADFDQIKLMFERGIIRDDPERINESYWMQPEWFPNYDKFVSALEELAKVQNREPAWSLGIFDAEIYTKINKQWLQNPTETTTSGHGIYEIKNNSLIIKHRYWIRAVPGAVKHFGVGLYISYPKEALLLSNAKWGISQEVVKQDPNVTKQYIKARIDGPTEFILGIYLPKLNPDYMRQVDVAVEINKDAPKGKYIVQVDAGAPSRNFQEEQSLKYGLDYTDPNIGIYRGPNTFDLFIEII